MAQTLINPFLSGQSGTITKAMRNKEDVLNGTQTLVWTVHLFIKECFTEDKRQMY